MPADGPIVMSKKAIEECGCLEETRICNKLNLYPAMDKDGTEREVCCCISELRFACGCAKMMVPKED